VYKIALKHLILFLYDKDTGQDTGHPVHYIRPSLSQQQQQQQQQEHLLNSAQVSWVFSGQMSGLKP